MFLDYKFQTMVFSYSKQFVLLSFGRDVFATYFDILCFSADNWMKDVNPKLSIDDDF